MGARRMSPIEQALDDAELALAKLSNVIFDLLAEETEYKGNLQWADAAVDRTMTTMQDIRRGLLPE